MAATGSDGILAYNLTSNLCGVQTNQFIATTRTYDLSATSQNRPHYAVNGLEPIYCEKFARCVRCGGGWERDDGGRAAGHCRNGGPPAPHQNRRAPPPPPPT